MGSTKQPSFWQRNWRVAFAHSWPAQACAALFLVFAVCAFYVNVYLYKEKAEVIKSPPLLKVNAKFSGDEKVKFLAGDKQVGLTNPALASFIQNLLAGPSRQDYNLSNPNAEDYSEDGQSLFVDELLSHREDGFYLEAGGYDGELYSNSLFFEKMRGWQGLLIEPDPNLYVELLLKRRKANSLNACLSPTNRASILKFKPDGLASGLVNKLDSKQQESLQTNPAFRDFVALDIVGTEIDVLRSIPLDKVTIDVFQICYEVNKPGTQQTDVIAKVKKLQILRDFFVETGIYEEAGILPKVKGQTKQQIEENGQDVFFIRRNMD